MNLEDSKKLMSEIKENIIKLKECSGPHDFSEPDKTGMICSKCKGRVDTLSAMWYIKGLNRSV